MISLFPCPRANHVLGVGHLWRAQMGQSCLAPKCGAVAGLPVARMGPAAAGSDAAHLLDGLVEQKRDMGHVVSLGTTSDPVVGGDKQGESAGSAKIKGMKRRLVLRLGGIGMQSPPG